MHVCADTLVTIKRWQQMWVIEFIYLFWCVTLYNVLVNRWNYYWMLCLNDTLQLRATLVDYLFLYVSSVLLSVFWSLTSLNASLVSHRTGQLEIPKQCCWPFCLFSVKTIVYMSQDGWTIVVFSLFAESFAMSQRGCVSLILKSSIPSVIPLTSV